MKNDKNVWLLLTPSWVTNFIGITLGILITGATIVLSQYQGSELRRQIFEVQTNSAGSSSAYDNITSNIADNSFLGALPLLIVWACVGLVVYFFAAAILRSFGQAAALHDELEYVHVTRQARIREALLHLGIRAVAAVGWFVFIKLSLSVLIPYALAAASIASHSFSLQNVGYALLAVLIIYGDVCMHAIFLRLVALKPRLFS
ncbi:MAG: hypothetical protein JWN82_659 [Candidatus Saccharibacteria bacterium]|nr:hypothetical protein [Candidatus Saccharibacteria bacterium]